MSSSCTSQAHSLSENVLLDLVALAPDTGWGTEVRELMRTRHINFDAGLALVFERYFNQGDCRPLIDAKGRAKARLGPDALERVCALLFPERDSDTPLNYYLGFNVCRGRGQPVLARNQQVLRLLKIIRSGVAEMSHGKDPGGAFWTILLASLDAKFRASKYEEFPLRARLEAKCPKRGRRKDPELITRNAVLADFVKQAIDRGDGYDAAIFGTKEKLKRLACSDPNRTPKVCEKTIRDAYDSLQGAT